MFFYFSIIKIRKLKYLTNRFEVIISLIMVFDTRDFKADPTYTLGGKSEISYGSLKKLSVDAITFSLFLHSSQIFKNKGTF